MVFNRQKVLLALIRASGGSVSRMQLVKLGFVLAHETPTRGGDTFYDFVPYKFGPYSFTLVRDVDALVTMGLLAAPNDQTWTLTNVGEAISRGATALVAADAETVSRRWRDQPVSALVDHVYENHAWFTVNAQRLTARRAIRPPGKIAVHTVGYERLSLDALLDLLLRRGVKRMIDIRANPVSRRFGFHRSTLDRHCGFLDVEYVHVPELGIASEERTDIADPGDRARLFARYRDVTLARGTGAIARVAALLSDAPSALLCQEADPRQCHRGHLASVIVAQTGLPLVDIGWPR